MDVLDLYVNVLRFLLDVLWTFDEDVLVRVLVLVRIVPIDVLILNENRF